MKILIDMNLSPRWVAFLVSCGFEAVHWSQVGPADAHDDELMRWAAEHDHVVLTSDLDFGAILAATKERRPSVLQLRNDLLTPEAMGRAVVAALNQVRAELESGALVSLDAVRARLRVLPLGSSLA
jgi:predicted nuclease of predicted toxin-antitoxin system